MGQPDEIAAFIAHWRDTGGSELANTQSFINGLCALIGVPQPHGSKADDAGNDYVFERRVFQDNGDGTQSFGRIDCYKRDSFILEAKQGSDADRAAADRGDADLDLFGQTATSRMKRGTARRGTPGWAKAMVQAKGQAERYARALPADHGWPPFLLIADIGYCIEVYADFTGTGRAYAQFPDRSRYRIMLEDLHDPDVRERLRMIWTDPKALDPSIQSTRVTREIADLLAKVSKRLESRGHDAEAVSGFLMRVLFTMFAEDTGVLLPKDSFKTLLTEHENNPEHLHHSLSALWQAMDRGEFAPALRQPVKRFNGYLFKNTEALPIDAEELHVLIDAAAKDWTEVEPAIFGTLLERALSAKDRSKLGAHYTPRAYVERLISPTIMEPLRGDWDGVRVAAATLIDEGKADDAKRLVEAFHAKLASTKVLDPACGTGNFLYVAMARMKELEGEVLDLLIELGDDQYVAELTGHTITPENFLGIEINPRAAAIAQLVLWIGYLQWHFRVNGQDRSPPEPILRDIKTIENRDALISYEARVPEKDEHNQPLTRWDGETMKVHPVTGRMVPDEDARVEVYRYVKPVAAKWPKADFIVGNPPFIGNKRMRERLGDGYAEAVRAAYPKVTASVDIVMYWWHLAAQACALKSTRRFGFITTNSITQPFNRSVIEQAQCCLAFAVPDHPWVDEKDGAAVRIAMTVAAASEQEGVLTEVIDESALADGYGEVAVSLRSAKGRISSALRLGANTEAALELAANQALAVQGMNPLGLGFRLEADDLAQYGIDQNALPANLKPYLIGRDLVQRHEPKWVVDFYGLSESAARTASPVLYQHILHMVKPERDQNRRATRRDNWWLFGENAPTLRRALSGLDRAIATCRTAKHRIFIFVPSGTILDAKIIGIAMEDAYALGVLTSHIHTLWAIRTGGWLGKGNDSNYNHSDCFGKFPFPADVPSALRERIRADAEALDALRKRVLAKHEDLTLTKLYNVLEALREGRRLTDAERDMHDRGLVTLIRQHHERIDALVAEAYGWPADLADEEILTRLVALNRARAAEEAKGHIRWLRPEYQAPDYRAPVTQSFDLGEGQAVVGDNVIPWPGTLPEQVSAIQSVLASAPSPLAPQDVARAFKGKRASSVRPVLDALAGIGMARRLADGRYAA
ncbi:class I SAM-dependent DNA methyltransferase [Erythrobacter sp. WG]|uniref:class I SAM-dependent DNA methyltransferase n=1 Tax=Erythrobacter sp. WG TaxID=2985510 RepID=UPI00226FF2E3|nr:DNA methyltransferase [Erythrobacter sp. WG]MCX9147474.1 class I SAM-dependent DNA methyltransferase [Erythrobacter sp. WG]